MQHLTEPSADRLARLEAFAERVFARPALTMPAFLDADHIAFLDNRSGVPQVARLTISTGEIVALTEGSERVMTLQANAATNTLVYGRDLHGNEHQQLWRIAHAATDPQPPVRFTQDDGAMFDQGAISTSGQYVHARVNSRDKAIFDVERIAVATGERQTLIENSWETGSPSVIAVRADDGQAMVASLNGNIDADLLRVDIGPEGDIAVTNILPARGGGVDSGNGLLAERRCALARHERRSRVPGALSRRPRHRRPHALPGGRLGHRDHRALARWEVANPHLPRSLAVHSRVLPIICVQSVRICGRPSAISHNLAAPNHAKISRRS
ncbi:MAG: hypothetical protein QM753_07625 [Thermomicrobiales bacterium]